MPLSPRVPGAHAIGDASRLIGFGDADVMIAGGAEAALQAGYCRVCCRPSVVI